MLSQASASGGGVRVRGELVGCSEAGPDDYRVAEGWLGGTAILQQAMEEADEAE